MTDAAADLEAAAAVLAQVVELGPTPRSVEFATAVSRHIAERPERLRHAPDPDVAAALGSMDKACPMCGRAYDEGARP
jgi:hypothetical protein